MQRAEATLIIETAQTTGVMWTSEASAAEHLARRIEDGHISSGTNLEVLDGIVLSIIQSRDAQVLEDDFQAPGLLVAEKLGELVWVVKLNLDARVVTAFPLSNPASYLGDPSRRYIGRIHELTRK